MKIYLVRHGKSDKSFQGKIPHNEFELKRQLIEEEEEKAFQLGMSLKKQLGKVKGYDFVFSGKERSKQTVLAIASGFRLSKKEVFSNLREDFGLIYLTSEQYWHDCEQAVKDGTFPSHADFFLKNLPIDSQTFSADYMRENMRAVLRRAIERNLFLGKEVSVMVSHEPVISLCLSDLTEKSVTELGGSSSELEYAEFTEISTQELYLNYRNKKYKVRI